MKTKVNFKNNILNISVSLTANYEVDKVRADRKGATKVRRDERRVRRILRSALPTTEKNNEEDAFYGSSRRVQEDLGSGEFEVKASLVSRDNSAASVCTVGSTVAGLMSVVVGAAGVAGAALMV